MRNCFANKRFLNILLLISLVGFLILPKICLADDFENIKLEELSKYLELPVKDANELIDTLRQVFTTEGILSWTSSYATPEEISVDITLLKIIEMQVLSHLLVDAPLEVLGGIIKEAKTIFCIIYFNPECLLEKAEKESVKEATEYGMKVLFQNQIRVTPGAIKFKYYSYKGEEKEIVLQYVMIYKPESEKRARVAIRFYMPNFIEAPAPEKYNKGITSVPVPDLRKDLPPFIVEVSGRVEKDEKLDNYWWIDENGKRITEGPEPTLIHPTVKIEFPPKVPDLGIKPLSTWEKYVLKPIDTVIKEVEIIITKVTGKSIPLTKIWNEIKAFLAKIKPAGPAAVVKETETAEVGAPQAEPQQAEIQKKEESPTEIGQEVGRETEIEKRTAEFTERSQMEKPEEEEVEEELEKKTEEKLVQSLPKILISEVCVGLDKAENEFVELYNPNDTPVSLSDENFNLKLVSSSDDVTKKKISWNKNVIPAKGYFLLVGGELKIDGQTLSPDATFSSQLTGTSGVIISDGEGNVLDKVAWGKPDKLPPSEAVETQGVILDQGLQTGKSLERKKQGNNLIDTNNNSQDFILSSSLSPTNSSGQSKVYIKSTSESSSLSSGSGGSSSSGSSGSSASSPAPPPSYPKILISEIQISPTGERFIELYNPNKETVNLTGWYIQRKTETGTSWNSLVSSTKFEGKSIQPRGYFLIARTSIFSPEILLEDLTLTKNNSLVFKNPNRDTVDEVNWGDIPAGLSYGRIWDESSQNYLDNFEIQIPTPKAKNQRDITPPEIKIISTPPSITNQTQAIFFFQANEENCAFECKLDEQNWESCQTPITYSDLSDGQHTFSVKARDLFLNESSPADYTWIIDTSIESPTISLFDLNTNSQFYTNQLEVGVLAFVTNEEEGINWFLSENNQKPTPGVGWLEEKPTGFTFSTPSLDGVKTVYIWSKDKTGNISELGNSASIILDTTPPVSQIIELELWQTSTTFTISWSGSDLTSGVADYTFQYTTGISDGVWLDLETETEKTSLEFSGQDGISYYFRVKAKDKAQNEGPWSEIVSTTIDASPPEIISFNVPYFSDQLSFEISWSGIDPISAVTSSGIDGFQLRYSDDEENWIYYSSEDEYTLNTKYDFSGQDEKTYYFQIKARDKTGNESQWFEKSTKIEVPKDKTPPEVNFNSISETQNSIFFSLSWTAEDPIGNVTPSGIEIFSIQYSSTPPQDGLKYLESGKWKNWPSLMALELGANENEIKLEGKDGSQYSFSIKAIDRAGNESEADQISTKISLPVLSRTVVINEIAWMGTKANSADEWIEFYNNSDQEINLAGWGIYEGEILIEPLTGKIGGNSYYLIERSDEETIKDIPASQKPTGWGGDGLNNNGEKLILRDQFNNPIDIVDCSTGWFAGDNSTKQTMERIDSTKSGSDSNNWHSNNLITRNGKDAGGNNINGTPKTENSVSKSQTEIFSGISAFNEFNQITLTYLGSPYIVKWELTIPQGKTLTIEPGVVIKFKDGYSWIRVNGTLKAIGEETDDKKIVFTSFRDDEYGGDTNNDGTSTSPSAGNWRQIYFSSSSTNSQLENVIVRYGGYIASSFIDCPQQMAGILVDNTSISLKDSRIENNKSRGLYLINSPATTTIDHVQFLNQVGCHGEETNTLLIEGGSPAIKNSLFKENSYGIYIRNWQDSKNNLYLATPVIENNIFEENKTPIYLSSGYPSFENNQMPGNSNTFNGVFVAGWFNIERETTWQADLPYIIEYTLTILPDATLTLNPGVVIKFISGYSRITVQGTLKAIGKPNEKIVFTSYFDDEYGGSGGPSAGNWGQIYFTKTSTDSQLENVIVRYGGCIVSSFIDCPQQMAGILVDNTSISLKDSRIENNKSKGLYLINSSSTIDGVEFLNHRVGCKTWQGTIPAIALLIEGGSPTIKNSTFKNNYYGIYIQNGNPTLENLTFEDNTKNIYPSP
jgi:parallel beta-helix repeat protein